MEAWDMINVNAGLAVLLVTPISEMEEMMFRSGITRLTYLETTRPLGYARCRDDLGVVWHIHPEALAVSA